MPATAVGWWAKSSMTVTPPTVPTTSWRRRTPRNSASAAAASSHPMPTSRATRRTPSALRALIAPGGWSTSRQTARPPSRTVKRVAPSSVKSVMRHSFASPRPKRRTRACVPRITSSTCGKSPHAISGAPAGRMPSSFRNALFTCSRSR